MERPLSEMRMYELHIERDALIANLDNLPIHQRVRLVNLSNEIQDRNIEIQAARNPNNFLERLDIIEDMQLNSTIQQARLRENINNLLPELSAQIAGFRSPILANPMQVGTNINLNPENNPILFQPIVVEEILQQLNVEPDPGYPPFFTNGTNRWIP